jgi:hypothetical protein
MSIVGYPDHAGVAEWYISVVVYVCVSENVAIITR